MSAETRFGPRERGAATVLILALLGVAMMVALAGVALGRATHARGMAQAAADLGALAAADAAQSPALQPGSAQPCAVAAQVVAANGARLTSCDVLAGGLVDVTTAVTVTPMAGWTTTATAAARAGPVR